MTENAAISDIHFLKRNKEIHIMKFWRRFMEDAVSVVCVACNVDRCGAILVAWAGALSFGAMSSEKFFDL
jgi:hypothetical protein